MWSLIWVLGHPYVIVFARLVLSTLFFTSGFSKLLDIREFIQAVLNYEILPYQLARAYGSILPWLECLVGLMLFWGLGTKIAALLSMLMLVSFIIAIGINLFRGRKFDCGCSGWLSNHQLSRGTVIRDFGFLSLAMVIFFFDRGWLSLDALLIEGSQSELFPPLNNGIPLILLWVFVLANYSLWRTFNSLRTINSQEFDATHT